MVCLSGFTTSCGLWLQSAFSFQLQPASAGFIRLYSALGFRLHSASRLGLVFHLHSASSFSRPGSASLNPSLIALQYRTSMSGTIRRLFECSLEQASDPMIRIRKLFSFLKQFRLSDGPMTFRDLGAPRPEDPPIVPNIGWHYLSNATCLIRPRLCLRHYLSIAANRICCIICHV